jgi:CHAT domain-containing protein
VGEWRSHISDQLSGSPGTTPNAFSYGTISHRLYKILIEPAARLIRGRDLIIVPSGALNQLAFEALVVSEPGEQSTFDTMEYMVKRHAITYAPSVSVLAEIEARGQQTNSRDKILLVGDANDDSGTTGVRRDSHSERNLDRLPAARVEVLDIAAIAEQSRVAPTIWFGSDASEDKLRKSDLSEYRFIHIATHSLSDYQDGATSALTLSRDAEGREDGVLTSDEITQLKLNSELVVLSGCETSIGEETGAEGVVGLNRTFLIAGTQCVCGSLWPVEDSSTQKLMSIFYQKLIAEKLHKAEALRNAKLAALGEGALPCQWAPFILVGSPR